MNRSGAPKCSYNASFRGRILCQCDTLRFNSVAEDYRVLTLERAHRAYARPTTRKRYTRSTSKPGRNTDSEAESFGGLALKFQ